MVEELIALRKKEKAGNSFSAAIEAARGLVTARCDHEKRTSAVQCIQGVIGESNLEHFFVATMDGDIRKMFQEVPGVPIIYGHKNALFLEKISTSQRQHANEMAEARLSAAGTGSTLLGKRRTGDLEADDSPDTHDALEDQVFAPKSTAKSDSARFKRNRPKGPNPLSCKKKKSQGKPSSASKPEHKDGDNAGKKRTRDTGDDANGSVKKSRKRKRSRKSKSAKPGDTDG